MDDSLIPHAPPRPHRKKKPPKQPRQRYTQEDRRLDQLTRFYEHCVEPITEPEERFRHSHWKVRRDKITRHLAMSGVNGIARNRWENCGSGCTVQRSPTLNKLRLRANYCHSRHCEPCMRAKANIIAANLQKRLAARPAGRYRFITLTLKHTDTPLAAQIKRLYAAFRKLRANKLWKTSQAGGLFTLEVKLDRSTWHPHLHVIAEGGWIDQRRLSEAWLKVTGDSFVVDVRALVDQKEAAFYVTKYVTKGTTPNVWDNDDRAQEWIVSVRGVRTAATYGTWRGLRLVHPDREADDWIDVCTLRDLLAAHQRQEPWAEAMYLALRPAGVALEHSRAPPSTAVADDELEL